MDIVTANVRASLGAGEGEGSTLGYRMFPLQLALRLFAAGRHPLWTGGAASGK